MTTTAATTTITTTFRKKQDAKGEWKADTRQIQIANRKLKRKT